MLMEVILHHLGCKHPVNIEVNWWLTTCQLVQDWFDQQYHPAFWKYENIANLPGVFGSCWAFPRFWGDNHSALTWGRCACEAELWSQSTSMNLGHKDGSWWRWWCFCFACVFVCSLVWRLNVWESDYVFGFAQVDVNMLFLYVVAANDIHSICCWNGRLFQKGSLGGWTLRMSDVFPLSALRNGKTANTYRSLVTSLRPGPRPFK